MTGLVLWVAAIYLCGSEDAIINTTGTNELYRKIPTRFGVIYRG
jgi:hypothetical protein